MGQPDEPGRSPWPIPGREMQRWPLLAWLLPLLPLLSLIGSLGRPEQRSALVLSRGIPAFSAPFLLEGDRWGAPRLDLQVRLPANSSASYDVDLLDQRQRPLLQLTKEAWREVTAWREEGESGVEDLEDTAVRLDLRPAAGGTYQLQVTLEELLDGAGRPLDQPLAAELRVRNHVLGVPLLLLTAGVSTALVALALRAFSDQGRQRVHGRRSDPHLDCRLVMGGPGLVRLDVAARYEGGLATQVLSGVPELTLEVGDATGAPILSRRLPLRARRRSSDGCHWWYVETRLLLRFAEADSRRVRVVLPEQLRGTRAELETARLTVLDGCRVLWPAPVLPVPDGSGTERGTVQSPRIDA